MPRRHDGGQLIINVVHASSSHIRLRHGLSRANTGVGQATRCSSYTNVNGVNTRFTIATRRMYQYTHCLPLRHLLFIGDNGDDERKATDEDRESERDVEDEEQ